MKSLEKAYKYYRKRYFRFLPPLSRVTLRWADFRRKGVIGLCEFMGDGTATISIDERLRAMPTVAEFTLVHELVHLELSCCGPRGAREQHGPLFQKKMIRLAKLGCLK